MKEGLCPDFPVMVDHWLSSTAVTLMMPEQEGAYFRLLCYAWSNADCSLPDDDETLSKLSRLNGRWETLGPAIKACFVKDKKSGRLYNPRQMETRNVQNERVKKAKEHAKSAAKSRWKQKIEQCPSNARAMPEQVTTESQECCGDTVGNMPKHASNPHSPLPITEETKKEDTRASLETEPNPGPSPAGSAPEAAGQVTPVDIGHAELPSEAEVVAYAETLGLPAWRAKDEYLKQMAKAPAWSGCLNWRFQIQRVRTWWQANGAPATPEEWLGKTGKAPKTTAAPRQPFASEIRRQIESIEARMLRHPVNPKSVYNVAHPTPEQIEEYKTLRADLARLQNQLREAV